MVKYRFAYVGGNVALGQAIQRLANPEQEEVAVYLQALEDAIPLAGELEKQDVEILLTSEGTGATLSGKTSIPIIPLRFSHLDLLRAFVQAREFSSTIAYCTYLNPLAGLDLIGQVLGIRLVQIPYSSSEDLRLGLQRAITDGVGVVVTKSTVTAEMCEKLEIRAWMVDLGQETLLQSLAEAREIAGIRRREKSQAHQLEMILESVNEGVIVINDQGIVTVFNRAAHEITGISQEQALGKPIPEVFPNTRLLEVLKTGVPELDEFFTVGDITLVTNRIPIVSDGRVQGVVATFRDASKIQTVEHRLRKQVSDKGFVAKYSLNDFDFVSARMKELLGVARRYARTEMTVLIEGETGTGKEILAHSLHRLSPRHDRPFIAINCSALPETLLESELFGYAEGAFTGARRGGKMGLFELAHEGTIFLDEIAGISERLQSRFLRVLQEKEVMRVGGDRIIPVDVRIIAATHRNLKEEVHAGRFRQDLYYRLAVLELRLPPLRERPEDIPQIAEKLYKNIARTFAMDPAPLSRALMERLCAYSWPGNVREMESVLKRLLLRLDGRGEEKVETILEELLQEVSPEKEAVALPNTVPSVLPSAASVRDNQKLSAALRKFERDYILRMLDELGYNRPMAARRLGISLTTLWRKLQ